MTDTPTVATFFDVLDEVRPLGGLTFDPKNMRRHSPANLKAIRESLLTFRQVKPLVVRGDEVMAGNGTLRAMQDLQTAFDDMRSAGSLTTAAKELDIQPSHVSAILDRTLDFSDVRVVVVSGDMPDERLSALVRSYGLVDNRTTDLSEFDWEEVSKYLQTTVDTEYDDIARIGFADYEIEPLISAHWEPPPSTPDGLDVTNPAATRGDPVRLSKVQRTIVDEAVAKARSFGDPKMDEGEAMNLICKFYVEKAKTPRKSKPKPAPEVKS